MAIGLDSFLSPNYLLSSTLPGHRCLDQGFGVMLHPPELVERFAQMLRVVHLEKGKQPLVMWRKHEKQHVQNRYPLVN